MLERLHTVDWNALTHAYGPAGDIPGLIRALAATDHGDAAAEPVSTER